RTRFFTETAHDAAREVDAEKFRVPTAVLVFGFLQRDAVYRARHGAEVTSHTALFPVRIAGQNDAAAPAREHVGHHVRVFHRVLFLEQVSEYQGQGHDL